VKIFAKNAVLWREAQIRLFWDAFRIGLRSPKSVDNLCMHIKIFSFTFLGSLGIAVISLHLGAKSAFWRETPPHMGGITATPGIAQKSGKKRAKEGKLW